MAAGHTTLLVLLLLGLLFDFAIGHGSHIQSHLSQHLGIQTCPLGQSTLPTVDNIPFSTRAYWMRQANLALPSACPFAAFGAVVVNHTGNNGLGELICMGANSGALTGNPTLHGEMVAISNCSTILTDPNGSYHLTASEAINAFTSLSLYTNAESCPMCASAIRWTGFREYIYGTSIDKLIEKGWRQIRISSVEVFQQSLDLPHQSRLIAEVLTNETDPYFLWQYDPSYPCPSGCIRSEGSCVVSS